jgi:hypothetical protein
MNKNDRFNFLLDKYLADNITINEREEFFQLFVSGNYDTILSEQLNKDLKLGFADDNADLPPHIAQEIIKNIYNAEKNTAKILPINKINKSWYWAAAAAVIFVALSVYFLSFNQTTSKESPFLSLIPTETVIQKNSTNELQMIHLSDGSVVSLYPNAVLHFPKTFKDEKREVYLEGGAFFQVAKNPEKPFLVFYNDIVTKVLGTSFSINTNQKTGNVEVAVRTGRVQVFENIKLIDSSGHSASVIVTRNQKAIYFSGKRLLETALVDEPSPATLIEKNTGGSRNKKTFVFDQEKLENIFKQLEDLYGIEIVVENSNLNNCVFTGDISNQDLFTQLKIICLTTNSAYEINGTKILITGKGCP